MWDFSSSLGPSPDQWISNDVPLISHCEGPHWSIGYLEQSTLSFQNYLTHLNTLHETPIIALCFIPICPLSEPEVSGIFCQPVFYLRNNCSDNKSHEQQSRISDGNLVSDKVQGVMTSNYCSTLGWNIRIISRPQLQSNGISVIQNSLNIWHWHTFVPETAIVHIIYPLTLVLISFLKAIIFSTWNAEAEDF